MECLFFSEMRDGRQRIGFPTCPIRLSLLSLVVVVPARGVEAAGGRES
jgi:hypothetical protein